MLPCGGCAEEDAVPVLISERFAVVVPKGVELAGGAHALAFAGELLDIFEGELLVGVDLAVVVDGGRNPGLEARVEEGFDLRAEAARRVGCIAPGDGDGLGFEGGGQGFEQGGGVVGDVAPEENLAMEGLEGGDDPLEEVEVDGAEGAGVDVGLGLAYSKVDGFVGADVEEGAGVVGGKLGEPSA